jgi:hypothetical protein
MLPPIPVLFTRRSGWYQNAGCDCYDETRDALTWTPPGPVIAHPPCGGWGRCKNWHKKNDKHFGPWAVDVVRRHRGIVEQPADSSLWRFCAARDRDLWGGRMYRVNQADFGHLALKPTDLYVVGLPEPPPMPAGPSLRLPALRPLLRLCRAQRERTPPAFGAWLVAWVRSGTP